MQSVLVAVDASDKPNGGTGTLTCEGFHLGNSDLSQSSRINTCKLDIIYDMYLYYARTRHAFHYAISSPPYSTYFLLRLLIVMLIVVILFLIFTLLLFVLLSVLLFLLPVLLLLFLLALPAVFPHPLSSPPLLCVRPQVSPPVHPDPLSPLLLFFLFSSSCCCSSSSCSSSSSTPLVFSPRDSTCTSFSIYSSSASSIRSSSSFSSSSCPFSSSSYSSSSFSCSLAL